MQFTVAIDGPAAAGKGTISRALAAHFGFAHLDTGLLYRAVGRRTLDGVPAVIAASTLRISDLSRTDLRTQEVAQAASEVAANPQVRAALVAFQKDFARREGGAVLDGRDIGTVICPEAEAKLFVTASAEIRAHRRWLELTQAGHDADEAQVLADVKARDARDAGRADAPMKQAPDAILLDTSDMSIDAALETALAHVRDRKERHA
ncbi:(d)CMP kinase [Silicimonas algicola]|uniref:Cytidylate kinase n=1 Tax=Silicimonas algicola TaxID=1826607 RepID=A0A316G5H6_9RHOB|nr:d(CMP) kinase [Silicimonas algicola]AZQ68777.1 (d)CMP kinase [Silicimonas algicola]PWK56144.1 cytidylate kinase [Silicimonas algicola]